MALTNVDRTLLQHCLTHQPGAWNDFVDRYLGLIYHVIHHTAHLRSAPLRPEDTEDLAAEVLLQIVANDYAVLRQFRGNASLATYLTVIARRICVHELNRRQTVKASIRSGEVNLPDAVDDSPAAQKSVESLEEVERLRQTEVPAGIPMGRWALGWCLKNPAVTAVIPGCKDARQVQENAAAALVK